MNTAQETNQLVRETASHLAESEQYDDLHLLLNTLHEQAAMIECVLKAGRFTDRRVRMAMILG